MQIRGIIVVDRLKNTFYICFIYVLFLFHFCYISVNFISIDFLEEYLRYSHGLSITLKYICVSYYELYFDSIIFTFVCTQEDYLFRILSLAGYNLTDGADLKMFVLTASLCKKIVSVDGWMGKMIEKQNFEQMEHKWHKVRLTYGKHDCEA